MSKICLNAYIVYLYYQVNEIYPYLFLQRAQRGKWYGLFSNELTAILFMASASEFDQRLREDWNENRLNEAVFIFSTVVNNLFFAKIPTILFMNKMDLCALVTILTMLKFLENMFRVFITIKTLNSNKKLH